MKMLSLLVMVCVAVAGRAEHAVVSAEVIARMAGGRGPVTIREGVITQYPGTPPTAAEQLAYADVFGISDRQNAMEAQVRARADVLVERGFTADGIDFGLDRLDREQWMATAIAVLAGQDVSGKAVVGKKGKKKVVASNGDFMATFSAGLAVVNAVASQSGALRETIWAEGQTQAGLDALEKSAAWQGFFQDEEVTK